VTLATCDYVVSIVERDARASVSHLDVHAAGAAWRRLASALRVVVVAHRGGASSDVASLLVS